VVNFIRFQRVILNRRYWGYFTVFSILSHDVEILGLTKRLQERIITV